MKTFEVVITETLMAIRTVQAHSEEEAIAMVKASYENCEVELDFHDFFKAD
ncbi:DpnD/PcfM-like protein [Ureibacillus xyleni]|uniref:DpnD/PcfM-like protein n=1 Tax=Ureibacillus xyleni TaxID=614648 RepID=A0A285TJ00_9BACL|nr:DpnD/PcfM family protein [Ureibacillus xyleni]SOC22002.1 DpnD/PcfM-like protein [Ureibacillus xyleni]